jgi:DNA-binding CsgD family transcriptional regulator
VESIFGGLVAKASEADTSSNWLEPEVLTTPTEIEERLRNIERECRFSVDILVKGPSPSDTAERALQRILERGITIRCIYEDALIESPEGRDYLAHWRDLGEQQRVLPSVPFRAAVFDRSIVAVPHVSKDATITRLLVIRAGLGEAIATLFDLLWQSPADVAARGSGLALTAQQAAVLTLMSEGLSDRKIAKELGIGVRTVQRRLAELAESLGTVSRPSLAARAVLAGLVTPFVDRGPGSHPDTEGSSH